MISEKLSTDSRRMLQNGVPQFVGFCRCTPCRQRRGKEIPSAPHIPPYPDAPRAGSAEAKMLIGVATVAAWPMHPVQAAPRQRIPHAQMLTVFADAPRAGSAEAKNGEDVLSRAVQGCTPCRQRRGKASVIFTASPWTRCTPCRQRRGKAQLTAGEASRRTMHPVQAAPRQSRLWL